MHSSATTSTDFVFLRPNQFSSTLRRIGIRNPERAVNIGARGYGTMGTIVGFLIFIVFSFGIWFSYRLFMRGNTDQEKVAALLPADFKPDVFYRKGDTYVGYEKRGNRMVLVDWPHAKVICRNDGLSL